ncbi:MAG: RnfABCDGE type electron transport complex subunit G [Desulfovibrionales bacterium]
MREIISMIVVLSVITAVSGFSLSYLKISTAPLIEEQVLTYVQAPALKSIFPESSNDPIAERQTFDMDGERVTVFPVRKEGKLTALALEAFGPGYGGDIGVMVGFDVQNDVLEGIGITTMKETPGLGTRIAETEFTRNFIGEDPSVVQLSAKGGNVDAVSGATVSSAGTVIAVQRANAVYTRMKQVFLQTFQS